MLITFHSKATPDVLMRGDDAIPLLRAAGKTLEGGSLPERGVFTPAELKDAIAGLETAVRADVSPPVDVDSPDKKEEKVQIHQRAFPLLDMMRKSLSAGCDIIWETSRGW
jgi:hypothetical protein